MYSGQHRDDCELQTIRGKHGQRVLAARLRRAVVWLDRVCVLRPVTRYFKGRSCVLTAADYWVLYVRMQAVVMCNNRCECRRSSV